jgi:cytidylate kinase
MDGRDIGTCILPDADAKVFLTASPSVRAQRRYKELTEKGITCNLQEIEQDIIERDERDMNRAIAPLKQAEDAVLVDGSDLTIDQVVDAIIAAAVSHGLKE